MLCFQKASQDAEYEFNHSFPNKSEAFLGSQDLQDFLQRFYDDVQRLMLKQSDLNIIFGLSSQLVTEMTKVNSRLIKDKNGLNPLEVIDITSHLACNEIEKFETTFKREKKNICCEPVVRCAARKGCGNSI